jgi:hypothetical protein
VPPRRPDVPSMSLYLLFGSPSMVQKVFLFCEILRNVNGSSWGRPAPKKRRSGQRKEGSIDPPSASSIDRSIEPMIHGQSSFPGLIVRVAARCLRKWGGKNSDGTGGGL